MAPSLGGPVGEVLPQVAVIAVGVALTTLLVAVDTTSGAVTIAPPVDDGVFTTRIAVATMVSYIIV